MTSRRSTDRRRGWALAAGVGIAGALTVAGVSWLDGDEGGCATEDRRIGVTHGPDGWSAEARYQRWDDGERCRARIRVGVFAPGGTWEDEALAPAGLFEAEVDPVASTEGELTWEGDRIEVAGLTFDASELPRAGD